MFKDSTFTKHYILKLLHHKRASFILSINSYEVLSIFPLETHLEVNALIKNYLRLAIAARTATYVTGRMVWFEAVVEKGGDVVHGLSFGSLDLLRISVTLPRQLATQPLHQVVAEDLQVSSPRVN